MTKARILTVLGVVLIVIAAIVVSYRNDYSRLKSVEVGDTPVQPGALGKIVLTNSSSSKVEFPLRCFHKVHAVRTDEKALFSEVVVVPPRGSVEFDVNPEHAGHELPRMVANKACVAIWRGPFAIERDVWWFTWQHRRPSHKFVYEVIPK